MSGKAKDGALLLIVGLMVSAIAWAASHYMGEAAIWVWSGLMIFGLILHSFEKRRKAAKGPPSDQVGH
ncbi:hypothetical protein VB151_19315 [Xanthomonas fragariae]|uniref:Transmembrane protein n=1 Tax=Xanthomonas fragariae TaxID=48664 RepID=A0A1Y6HKL0_9XANT|nr:hypothetical protein [Xanthomonas fragariae]AOD13883.1 hypothetical protein BER92_03050 [Xanthomonas fragariae]AOD17274.1 hypothetical protein BER93_03055 [Xanthomonas fragariae]ENZ96204.1 hypothetical protein O1K_06187 [Xanthomonas fragariae LMG 25863]MBL9197618.1 hypothetical protein [Xanthomonas fragariae]MBL9222769.1 hypothetical protein [Xanthomonas fragariae]